MLLIAGVSPAWLLLLDRANSDAFILAALVLGAWLVWWKPSLLTWSAFAFILWVLGTVKYYPFALGAVLVFAIFVRFGWVVPVVFLAASSIYVGLTWSWYERSRAWTIRPDLFDVQLPAYGRVLVERAVVGPDSGSGVQVLTIGALVALMAVGIWLGTALADGSGDPGRATFLGVIAVGGALAFLGKVLWAGFGFLYTGAFLLLIFPVLMGRNGGDRRAPNYESRVSGVATSVGIVGLIAVFTPFNGVVATVFGILIAGVGLGAGIRIFLSMYLESSRPRSSPNDGLGDVLDEGEAILP